MHYFVFLQRFYNKALKYLSPHKTYIVQTSNLWTEILSYVTAKGLFLDTAKYYELISFTDKEISMQALLTSSLGQEFCWALQSGLSRPCGQPHLQQVAPQHSVSANALVPRNIDSCRYTHTNQPKNCLSIVRNWEYKRNCNLKSENLYPNKAYTSVRTSITVHKNSQSPCRIGKQVNSDNWL